MYLIFVFSARKEPKAYLELLFWLMEAVANKNIIAEITSTLEEIQKVNEMIIFHESFDQRDENAIQNFIRLKSNFLRDLNELMRELNLEVTLNHTT